MERADGNRKMWLLKRTSGHHRPECLAAAMALGILAGLVPKLNLLAVLLYGLILVLPVHTLLALGVSAVVAVLSFQLDAVAHGIGQSLLGSAQLRPLWVSLERIPLVPWMSLHNTVVLGQFLLGMLLLAPVYMISLRVFERLEYGRSHRVAHRQSVDGYAPVSTEEIEPLTTGQEPLRRSSAPDIRRTELPKPHESTVDRSPLIIPPPKLNRAVAETRGSERLHAPDEPILFEPIDDAQQRVNAWHMNHAVGQAELIAADNQRRPLTESAEAASAILPVDKRLAGDARSTNYQASGDAFYPKMTEASAAGRDRESSAERVPPMPSRPEGVMNSLELAHSASEVLAWVDELLDECMAAEGMTIVAPHSEKRSSAQASSAAEADGSASADGSQQRWLLETTIEIVRLTDETMSDQLLAAEPANNSSAQSPSAHSTSTESKSGQADLAQQDSVQADSAQAESLEPRARENPRVMSAESITRAWPSVGGVAASSGSIDTALPMQDAGEPTILNLNQVTGRSRHEDRAGFQQLVMASAVKDNEPRPTVPIEPVKGECLAYLLGHLRQTREGKST